MSVTFQMVDRLWSFAPFSDETSASETLPFSTSSKVTRSAPVSSSPRWGSGTFASVRWGTRPVSTHTQNLASRVQRRRASWLGTCPPGRFSLKLSASFTRSKPATIPE